VHPTPQRTGPRAWLPLASLVPRVAAWGAVLFVADRPWRELGGIVDERTRWLARFVLGTSAVLGAVAGATTRAAGRDGAWHDRHRPWRRAWIGPSAFVACVLVGLELAGTWRAVLLVLGGWLGYCAGLDLTVMAGSRLDVEAEDDDPVGR